MDLVDCMDKVDSIPDSNRIALAHKYFHSKDLFWLAMTTLLCSFNFEKQSNALTSKDQIFMVALTNSKNSGRTRASNAWWRDRSALSSC